MASNGTFQKRQKERARLDKQREKEAKRRQKRDERPSTQATQAAGKGDVDPDIAGIVPGPQPIIENQ